MAITVRQMHFQYMPATDVEQWPGRTRQQRRLLVRHGTCDHEREACYNAAYGAVNGDGMPSVAVAERATAGGDIPCKHATS